MKQYIINNNFLNVTNDDMNYELAQKIKACKNFYELHEIMYEAGWKHVKIVGKDDAHMIVNLVKTYDIVRYYRDMYIMQLNFNTNMRIQDEYSPIEIKRGIIYYIKLY